MNFSQIIKRINFSNAAFVSIVIFYLILFYKYLINKKKIIKYTNLSNILIDNLEKKIKEDEEKYKKEEEYLNLERKNLEKREKIIQRESDLNYSRFEESLKKSEEIKEKLKETERKLEEISSMTIEEAKNELFNISRKEIEEKIRDYENSEARRINFYLKEKATKIICYALEKYSSEITSKNTIKTIKIDIKLVNRLIGKDGRNINHFRKITGTDVIIDWDKNKLEKNNKEKNVLLNLHISSLNSIRREIALKTLELIIKEEKFSPDQIEESYEDIKSKFNLINFKLGEKILKELEIKNVHPIMINSLAELEYRTSYGQKVLDHSIEVSKISGNIAVELGLDLNIARRAGLFHDIGKSVDNNNYSHVFNGIELAKRCNESEIVINAIASHHKDYPANNLYSSIVIAADKISASRLGARSYQKESYIKRMNSLENIAKEFKGIKQIYSFQSGREIWVIINAEELNDYQTIKISKIIKKKIEEIIIPGEVTINFVREKKIIEKIRG